MLAFILVLFQVGALRAETVWVKTPNTIIRESRTAYSPGIATLDKGVSLEVLGREGRWYQVRLPSGKKGWVFRFKVTGEEPQNNNDLFDSLNGLFAEPTVREASSSASIRGLNTVSEDYAKRHKTSARDIRAVKEMEKFPVSADEIEKFLSEGKLGEYGQ